MPSIRALCLVAALAYFAAAQDSGPSAESWRPPALLAQKVEGEASVPLSVTAAQVRLILLGHLARVELELTFRNDTDRVLEGELVLPLPSGATIAAFALEVGGVFLEASVVERERARVIFEEIVRRNVDPGLVEWVQGNVFRTRIYPIPAKGTKTARLAYEWEAGERFALPLSFPAPLERFALEIRASGAIPSFPKNPLPDMTVEQGPGYLNAEVSKQKVSVDGALSVVLPPLSMPSVSCAAGLDGSVFFASVPVPSGLGGPAKKPERLTVVFDASTSRRGRVGAELELLERYLGGLGGVKVRLVVFSDAIHAEEELEGAAALLARLKAVEFDGGTRLACLDFSRWDDSDAILLMTDGLLTFGRGLPTPGNRPVHAITSQSASDRPLLEHLAAGGHAIELGSTGLDGALALLARTPVALLAVEGEHLSDLIPGGRRTISTPAAAISGRIRGSNPVRLVARFGDGQKTLEVAFTVQPNVRAEEDVQAGARLDRAWARAKVAELVAIPGSELAVKEIGLRFGIVTPQTSLLVLESLADHIRYRVVPPAGPWRDAYFEAIEGTAKAMQEERAARVAALVQRWQEKTTWWETKFEIAAGWKWKDPNAQAGQDREEGAPNGEGASGGAAPTEMPRSAPALGLGGARDAAPRSADTPQFEADSDDATEDAKKGEGGESGGKRVTLAPWTPDAAWTPALKEAGDAAWETYLRLAIDHGNSSAFFLDAADVFVARNEPERALQVLSNLSELELGSERLLRILGHRLEQLERFDLAAEVFAEVLEIRPEEPQSHRDLGLVLAQLGRYEEAIRELEAVITGAPDGRFPDLEILALGELNTIVARCLKETGRSYHTLPDALVKNLDVDLRITLNWDAADCDMDLWVIEPTGEQAFYQHTRTAIGGWFGRDFTQGYGPEEYLVKKALPGVYTLKVNFYGNRQQILAGATTIQIDIIRNYGRPNEERTAITRRLGDVQEVLDIGEITFP